MSKLAFSAQAVDIAYLSLRQNLFGISVWATARKSLTVSATFSILMASSFPDRHKKAQASECRCGQHFPGPTNVLSMPLIDDKIFGVTVSFKKFPWTAHRLHDPVKLKIFRGLRHSQGPITVSPFLTISIAEVL